METTIDKAERLTHYLKVQHRKSDALIDPVLDKLLDQERQTVLNRRNQLRTELDQFEAQFGIESSVFSDRFERGELGDDMDYFDWSATWRMYQSTLDSLETLES